MPRNVSAADANQQISQTLGQAAEAATVTRDMAMSRLLSTLEQGLRLGGGRLDRDELHDR